MDQNKPKPEPTRRAPRRRMAAALVAVGALVAPAFVVSTAGATTKTVVISTWKSTKYGTIVVSGKAVYTLKPGRVACGPNCLKVWPEVLLPKGATKATAGTGVNPGKLGTVRAARGALQVTYAGKPLYRFSFDKAGQVTGVLKDKWGTWSDVVLVKPAGNPGGGGIGF